MIAPAIVARIQCGHIDCPYQMPLIEGETEPGEYVHLELDVVSARIHHRYAHGEEIDFR